MIESYFFSSFKKNSFGLKLKIWHPYMSVDIIFVYNFIFGVFLETF